MKGIDTNTVEGKLQEILCNHGLLEDQAKAVMEKVKKSPAMEVMKHQWRDPASSFPAPFINCLWLQTRIDAVKWLDENAPKHWARAMLADEPRAASKKGATAASESLGGGPRNPVAHPDTDPAHKIAHCVDN